MSEPVLTRFGETALYWADPSDATAAFLANDPAALGDTPTLTRTWTDGGSYVFLGAAVTDPAAFLTTLQTWLAWYAPGGAPRFLWVADPAEPPAAWVTTPMDGAAGPGGTWVTDGATFQLADYTFAVSSGAVAPAGTAAGWGFTVADDGSLPASALYSPTDRLPARLGSTLLAMDAGRAGAWRCVLDAPAAAGDVFTRLGAGLRFFTPGDEGYVDTLHFAVLSQPAGPDLSFATQVDPLRPLDGERTSLGFSGWAATEAAALGSGYATVLGGAVTLRPRAASGTAPAARLVFGVAPYLAHEAGNAGYYLVPDGPFTLSAGPEGGRVLCGISGLEYVAVPPAGSVLTFLPGHAAYAPLTPERTGADALTTHGMTSWVSFAAAAGDVVYYSQPEDAPLYSGSAGPPADGELDLLPFLEVPAADASGAVFPMAPFHGLTAGEVAHAVAVEQLAVAPARRTALLPVETGQAADAGQVVGVTPQGLGVEVAPDLSWNWLGIGHVGASAALPSLRFTTVTGRFRQAMQTNNLFLVLGNPDEFARHGSVAYQLTTRTLDVIGTIPLDRGGVPEAVLAAVRTTMADQVFPTRTAFDTALLAASPGMPEPYQQVFRRYGGLLTPVVGGWSFRLAPDAWRASTYLLVKFALGRSIAELVEDVSTWAWPEVAARDGKPATAQNAIREVVAQATGDAYATFRDVVHDPNWTGVLVLSADVPLDQLPRELQVLAAGIDAARFAAHHVGIAATPFRRDGGELVFDPSATFGLIDYRNPEDQYFSENVSFAFRVLQLTVGVRNAVTTTFTSRVELLVNRLFGAPARLLPTTHGNNVILDGALQRQSLPGGRTDETYVFSMAEQNTFQLEGLVLQSVQLLSTQLVTARAADPASGTPTVEAVFQLGGNLRFYEPERFDPFSYGPDAAGNDGYLRFGGLGIGMAFALGDPAGTTTFTLKDTNLSFDAANSVARPNSLVSRFPVRVSALVATPDPVLVKDPPPQTPAGLGYVSVNAPLDQSTLTQPWYGLDFLVDLGTLGALAGSKALAMHLLVAWSPGASGDDSTVEPAADPAVYLGVKLPGANGLLGISLALQGVVKLGFRSVEWLVDEQPGQPRSYTLRLRDFALRLLGLAFPPGHNDIVLFGNPDQAGASKVGWYAAYASDADPRRPPPPPVRGALARTPTRSARGRR